MASTRDWFETVAEARRRARRRLPGPVFPALEAGAEAGVTRADNVAAFGEIRFAPPRLADLPAQRDLGTSVLGTGISLPVIASPVGAQAVHPLGEVAVAMGTRDAGTAMGLSEFAARPAAEVAAVNPRMFFQVHWSADRDTLLARAEAARAAGATALILTLDWSFPGGRDWGSPAIPERLDLPALIRLAPAGLARPGYLAGWLRHGGLPDLTVPNMAVAGGPAPAFFRAYRDWMAVPPPTWADIGWLRAQWGGPFLVKGVMRPDDARRAVDAGATAISVSNHGGNNLDGTPASIRALPAVVAAVGGSTEILLDGGIRRGGDVVKALALGARAVLIGRACLWGLAAAGPPGVGNVFEILRSGIDSALLALGRPSVRDLVPEDVILPADFTRGLLSPGGRPRTVSANRGNVAAEVDQGAEWMKGACDMDEGKARELLQSERTEVASLLQGTEKAARIDDQASDIPEDFGDAGLPLTAEANDEAVAGELRERLDAIDRALARLDAGSYGRSVLSGKPIPDERLEADPAAELTIEEARAATR
jgi:pre-mycofactocin synthase